jgi:hypothetical protein
MDANQIPIKPTPEMRFPPIHKFSPPTNKKSQRKKNAQDISLRVRHELRKVPLVDLNLKPFAFIG